MGDVVIVDNVEALSEVAKKNDLVIVGLQEEDVIAEEMAQPIEEYCSSGVVTIVRNEEMLEQQALVEHLVSVVMVPKREDGEEVSTIGNVVSTIRENQFEEVETIIKELQQLLVVEVNLQQVVEEMRIMVTKVM